MNARGDILLVSCYELGHQPLTLASPLATLSSAGYTPAAVDTALADLTDADIRRAKLIAISVPMHTALRLGVDLARRIRSANPAAHVCFYGLYAWLNAAYLFAEGLVDSVIGGEFETPLLELAEQLSGGAARGSIAASQSSAARNHSSTAGQPIPGVSRLGHPAAPYLQRVPFQLPQREGLPALAAYAGLLRDGAVVPAGYVEATRGCKHTCAHCPITPVYRGRFFAVPRELVLADVRQQVRAGARHITFGDPDFLNGPTHALRLARALHAEFPDLTFDVTVKVEHILAHRELLPELGELGCAFLVSAVESLSDTVLAHLRKGHTRADVAAALEVLRAAAIPLRASLVSFTPWTTLEDYLDLLDFVAAEGLIDSIDPVHYAIRLLVPPGSALLDDLAAADWLGPLDEASFGYAWVHADARMERLFEEVSGIVAEAACEGHDAAATFGQVRQAAQRQAGVPLSPLPNLAPNRPLPPRLTETWFCCAEPVQQQLVKLAH
ncbi:MAG TPA: CUAEP/CCAEP-tail radical SAM protein [Chloroflexota bacterium]|nr:CUAEP/CCAEP-tail radical SAM protein [Chloroflexota bacterium]